MAVRRHRFIPQQKDGVLRDHVAFHRAPAHDEEDARKNSARHGTAVHEGECKRKNGESQRKVEDLQGDEKRSGHRAQCQKANGKMRSPLLNHADSADFLGSIIILLIELFANAEGLSVVRCLRYQAVGCRQA